MTTGVDLTGMRVGVVVNPSAGRGGEALDLVLRKLLDRLQDADLLLHEETAERDIALEIGIAHRALPAPLVATGAGAAAASLAEAGADVILGIGGDGTLCDIATSLLEHEIAARLIGIGVGSANVGPLVSLPGSAVDLLNPTALQEASVAAIDASVEGEWVGLAFNDVVFGNSYFGTRDGCRVDLDAAAKLGGEDRLASPSTVCGRETWISKNGRRILAGQDDPPAQIIASPINDPTPFAGKAISGLLCWAPYVGRQGVIAAASAVMVRTQLNGDDVDRAEPLRLVHASFGPGDRIDVGGLQRGAVLVLDGNPTSLLRLETTTTLRLRTNAARILRPTFAVRETDMIPSRGATERSEA